MSNKIKILSNGSAKRVFIDDKEIFGFDSIQVFYQAGSVLPRVVLQFPVFEGELIASEATTGLGYKKFTPTEFEARLSDEVER